MPQETKEKIIKIINEFWNDEDLQEAISLYGEWNGEKLNEAKEKALNKIINE